MEGKNGSKNRKPRVDNKHATGKETIYRTKAYTYLEKDGKMIRVPGATPIGDTSVIHGPPSSEKLAAINSKNPKQKKIVMSTATVLTVCTLYMIIGTAAENKFRVTSNNCYGEKLCGWLTIGSDDITTCAKCLWRGNATHIVVGSNGREGNANRLIYINSKTGVPNTNAGPVKFAPLENGTFLWEMYKGVARNTQTAKQMETKFKDLQEIVESEKNHRMQNLGITMELHESVGKYKERTNTELRNVRDALRKANDITESQTIEIQRYHEELQSLKTHLNWIQTDMQHLVMDAVNSFLTKMPA